MLLKTLIVDDEPLARKAMERLANKHENLSLVGVFENGNDAIEFIEENIVDLILLDVEMPEMNGFQLLESLDVMPLIIMTTTKENYAFDAFQYQVSDYLKKPITIPKFNAAIDKLIQSEMRNNKREKETSTSSKQDIYLKVDSRLVRVLFDEIVFVENVGDYVKVVLEKENLIVYTTMKHLVEKLPDDKFMRVHRSFIVNLNRIRDIEQNSLLIRDQVIPVSRAAKPELMERLNLL